MAGARRNDEGVAETMGVNATAYKVSSSPPGGFFAGVAGAAGGIFQNLSIPTTSDWGSASICSSS